MSPSYQEMKQGSQLIEVIREQTTNCAKRFSKLPALRADILWADSDNVVIDECYEYDRNRGRATGQTHTSVCKPMGEYLDPMRLVQYGEL